jgi:chromosome segregation ATPase
MSYFNDRVEFLVSSTLKEGNRMARELNNDLFGAKPIKPTENTTSQAPNYAKTEEVRALYLQVELFSRKIKEFESRVETMHTKVEDVVSQNRSRFERVQSHFKNQGEMLQNALSDVHQKIAQVVSRMNERKLSEGVVKEMVDRHTNVVQAFEARLQQMQKVMSEQELQLMHARSELKQALHELSRLKRG